MKTFLAALLAGGAKLGFRVIAFIVIVLIAALVSWASPFSFFVLTTIAFGCSWFGLVKITGDDTATT